VSTARDGGSPSGVTSAARPLEGLLVVDLSRVLAGPYATQLLGDLGAEVWKIERPVSGDETRAWGPPFVGGESAYYLAVNRNKKSAALDFEKPQHLATLRAAIRRADIVVENFVPGDLDRFGLNAAALRLQHPQLIVCSITGFGQDGPYARLPGYDAVLQGFTGLMSVTGEAGGGPLKVGVAVVDILTGAHALSAMLAALVGRLRGGGGATLDISLFEVGVAALSNLAQATLVTGELARRHGNAHAHIVPYQTFEASDGALVVAVGNDAQWLRLCEALDLKDLALDPSLALNPGRLARRDEIVAAIARRLLERPRAEWLERLRAARVPAGPVRDLGEVMRDPALTARGMVQSSTLPGQDKPIRLMAAPWLADGVRPPIRSFPPRLGEHTQEFLARFG
jgi:crotonobetainyl-CoA:carnitine CoA-transferase CaiB-like acyl-CoA transferase